MTGVVLAAHGGFAEGLLDSAKMIWGATDNVIAVSLQPETTPEAFGELLGRAANEIDDANGVVVLVDLRGGTPFNQACLASRTQNWPVVSGASLPMLLEVLSYSSIESPKELALRAAAAGGEGITVFNAKEQ